MTDYAEVIGDPIAHSKSPAIHKFWLKQLGRKAGYRKTRVAPAKLADHLAKRRADPAWRGCNVTVPHKQAVLPLLDRIDPAAEAIGAVNTIVPEDGALVGYNTDGLGFLEPLRPLPVRDRGGYTGSAIVIGTGGAARAVVHALWSEGVMVDIMGRDRRKAAALAADMGAPDTGTFAWDAHPLFEVRESVWGDKSLKMIVNATSLGMTGQPPLDVSLDQVTPSVTVYDIVYAPLETPLLAEARARGHPTIDGLAMLIGQAAAAFERFFGEPAPREQDAALRDLLTG